MGIVGRSLRPRLVVGRAVPMGLCHQDAAASAIELEGIMLVGDIAMTGDDAASFSLGSRGRRPSVRGR